MKIGIRREDKNVWERRVPIIPEHVRELAREHNIEFLVQPSPIRAFKEDEYRSAGAAVSEDLSTSDIVFAVKEMPMALFRPGGVYVFFSHTIKGQAHNMPMLKRLLELKCTLIDYEKITNDAGQRLVFFGHYAGLAGMIDTLWAAGRRLSYEGVKNPFEGIRPAHGYHNLEEAKGEISKAGEEIRSKGLDGSIVPFVVGIAGYGHVSKGVQEILACLPVKEITPEELIKLAPYNKVIYKVVFKEEHTVMPAAKGARFELQDYFRHPERYRGCFERYVPYLTLLVNCIYWDKRYPRLVTKRYLEKLYKGSTPSLRVIGDISCDVDGSIEATVRCTDSGDPVFVYDVEKKEAVPGYKGRGPVVLAVDNLPCELPRESSAYFSGALKGFIPAVAEADYNVSFDELALPPEIKRAVIVHKGELTPDYNYLAKGGNL